MKFEQPKCIFYFILFIYFWVILRLEFLNLNLWTLNKKSVSAFEAANQDILYFNLKKDKFRANKFRHMVFKNKTIECCEFCGV